MTTKIEWTQETWNPVTGCAPIATGCKNCYAREMHRRLSTMGVGKYQHEFGEIQEHWKLLDEPDRWRKPRRVFVCSMSDLFHEDVSDRFIEATLRVIADHPRHTFQILTKRPARMRAVVRRLPNLWVGTSCSTQFDVDNLLPDLLECGASQRFVSLEPLLGPIDLGAYVGRAFIDGRASNATYTYNAGLHWMIVGAESGPNRRPCDLNWIRGIRDQCVDAGVPLFVKQADIGGNLVKMPSIDGRVWKQYPQT